MAASEVADAIAPIASVPTDGLVRRLLRQRNAQIGLGFLAVYALAIFVGPLLVHANPSSDPNYQLLGDAFQVPSRFHPLGTDDFGRDELVRLIEGGRYTLLIGFAAVAFGLVVGVPLGAVSGHFKGWVDMLVQRLIDIVLAFPGFLLALALIAVLGPGLRNVIISVGVTSFPRFVRILRASVLTVREYPFIEAAHGLGVSSWRVLWRHNLPNALAPLIVQTPLELGSAILTAAGLGFLGLGVAQPTPEWGSMLGEARQFIFTDSGLVTFPGLAIVGVILAFNLVGDGLRDVLDPRQRGRS